MSDTTENTDMKVTPQTTPEIVRFPHHETGKRQTDCMVGISDNALWQEGGEEPIDTPGRPDFVTEVTGLNTYKVGLFVSETKNYYKQKTFLCMVGPYNTYCCAKQAAENYLHIIRHFGMKFGLRTAPEQNYANIYMEDGNGIFKPVSVSPIMFDENCEVLSADLGDVEFMLSALRRVVGLKSK